jgi:3-dehydroquinate synthase
MVNAFPMVSYHRCGAPPRRAPRSHNRMPQPAPLRIEITTPSRTYAVIVGTGTLGGLRAALDEAGLGPRLFAVSSPTVWGHWGEAFQEALPDAVPILAPDGERHKNLSTLARVYDALLHAGADRSAGLVTFGGGIIGDMGGFAAATYMRGLRLAHVPTTLLAQVDAAIGGKVGVNLAGGKNLVGAFYQPSAVVVDPAVLSTLPRREFRAGLYEVIKYGIACDAGLFERLGRDLLSITKRDAGVLAPVIAACCRIKGGIVAADERESGARRVLNFGHTVGHALEASTRYRRFLHGESVAYGMLAASRIAAARGVLPPADHAAVARIIAKLGPLPPLNDLSAGAQLEFIQRDKKVEDGRLHFVLPTAIGSSAVVTDVSEDELLAALREIGLGA